MIWMDFFFFFFYSGAVFTPSFAPDSMEQNKCAWAGPRKMLLIFIMGLNLWCTRFSNTSFESAFKVFFVCFFFILSETSALFPPACNVLYINSVEMESLTGPQAIAKAISETLAAAPPPAATVVHFKVSSQGITLTDNQRKWVWILFHDCVLKVFMFSWYWSEHFGKSQSLEGGFIELANSKWTLRQVGFELIKISGHVEGRKLSWLKCKLSLFFIFFFFIILYYIRLYYMILWHNPHYMAGKSWFSAI